VSIPPNSKGSTENEPISRAAALVVASAETQASLTLSVALPTTRGWRSLCRRVVRIAPLGPCGRRLGAGLQAQDRSWAASSCTNLAFSEPRGFGWVPWHAGTPLAHAVHAEGLARAVAEEPPATELPATAQHTDAASGEPPRESWCPWCFRAFTRSAFPEVAIEKRDCGRLLAIADAILAKGTAAKPCGTKGCSNDARSGCRHGFCTECWERWEADRPG
jgi:hypothetical protein